MTSERIEALVARLEKGGLKTQEIMEALTPDQWKTTVYDDPCVWDVRALLAHFVSSEQRLLQLAQHVAAGGEDLPADFDFNEFNAEEQVRLQNETPQALLAALAEARRATLAWVRMLDDRQLDLVGRHPALGEVTLETMINAIYGHQLLHMREARVKIG